MNICALAYKKVDDQSIYLYGESLLSEAFPLIIITSFLIILLHTPNPPCYLLVTYFIAKLIIASLGIRPLLALYWYILHS